MSFKNVVFLQDDEAAREALRILHNKTDDSVLWRCPTAESVSAAIEYLKPWDNDEGSISLDPQGGFSDFQERQDEYLLTYNVGLHYIGLEREI